MKVGVEEETKLRFSKWSDMIFSRQFAQLSELFPSTLKEQYVTLAASG